VLRLCGLSLTCFAGLVACSSPARPRDERSPSLAEPPAQVALVAPGPAPRERAFDPVAANAECARCHQEIATEWQGSLHQRAFVDETVQSQLVREPFAFCIGCHAPESDPGEPVPAAIGELGVGCVSCHVVERALYAGEAHAGQRARAEAPHGVLRAPGFDAAFGCGSCHEFAFPGERGRNPLLMQSTISEHQSSIHAEKSCGDCHMPLVPSRDGGRHKSHRFEASRSEAMLKRAVEVEAALEGRALVVTLSPGEVGHAFPTGDMLRRLVLELEVLDAEGEVRERSEQQLARHFGMRREPHGVPKRVLVRDDRVGARDAEPRIRFEPRTWPEGGSLRYELRYERVAEPAEREKPAVVEGSVVLAEGSFTLRASPGRP
jgi:hypothetical protein